MQHQTLMSKIFLYFCPISEEKKEEGIYYYKIMELKLRWIINHDGQIINWYEISKEVFCRTNGNSLTYWEEKKQMSLTEWDECGFYYRVKHIL